MAHRKAPRNPRGILTIEGACNRPTSFSFHDLASVHEYYQIPDVAKIDERLEGTGVRLRKLVDMTGPELAAAWITVESEDGQFAASLPLKDTAESAILIYAKKKKPLEREDGGPIRFIIPFLKDSCAKVKGATRMTISLEKGRDTRPSNAAEHAAIHAKD